MSHPAISISLEAQRGCGYRKPGAMYLVNDGPGEACGRIPFPLTVCSCCGEGFRPSRGYRWVDGQRILETAPACAYLPDNCREACAFRSGNEEAVGRAILIWVSADSYPTVGDFMKEAERMGVSRRITGDALPRGLVIGETWIFLAHKEAIYPGDIAAQYPQALDPQEIADLADASKRTAGVFHAFQPSRVEYVVTGEETDEEIESMVARGISPVQVFNE